LIPPSSPDEWFASWLATATAVGAVDAVDSLFVGSTLLPELGNPASSFSEGELPVPDLTLLFFPIPMKGGKAVAGARTS
jgi:hypothetical protein